MKATQPVDIVFCLFCQDDRIPALFNFCLYVTATSHSYALKLSNRALWAKLTEFFQQNNKGLLN